MLWADFQKPKKLDYDAETLTQNYGRFIAQPFERGFGTTIGNALRRVLLSSIEPGRQPERPGLVQRQHHGGGARATDLRFAVGRAGGHRRCGAAQAGVTDLR